MIYYLKVRDRENWGENQPEPLRAIPPIKIILRCEQRDLSTEGFPIVSVVTGTDAFNTCSEKLPRDALLQKTISIINETA